MPPLHHRMEPRLLLWWPPRGRELYIRPVSSQAQPARLLQCFDPLGTLGHLACSLEGLAGERIQIVKISFRSRRALHVKCSHY
jgi:hypothetical protein